MIILTIDLKSDFDYILLPGHYNVIWEEWINGIQMD